MPAKQSGVPAAQEEGFALFAIVTIGLGLAALGGGSLVDYFAWGKSTDAWLAVGLIASGLSFAHFARALQICKRLSRQRITSDETSGNKQKLDLGLRESFVYVFLSIFLLSILAFNSGSREIALLSELNLTDHGPQPFSTLQVSLVLCAIALSFFPIVVVTYLQERSASLERFTRWPKPPPKPGKRKKAMRPTMLRDDSISVSSFYFGTALASLIVALAIWAAKVSETEQFGIAQHLAFYITFGVVALFVLLIFLPHLQSYLDNFEDSRGADETKAATPLPLKALPTLASWIDSVLVRIVAPMSGATQHGPLVPHGFVLCSLIPLTAIGFILPPPWGLGPILFGMLLVFSLGRRWAWIEEDRETASRLQQTQSSEIHIGFSNDLKDEALLGYASLFILVPLALHQINGIASAFQGIDGEPISNPFFSWVSFFGGELAKAVPFVDWWEIYEVRIEVPIESVTSTPTSIEMAKHLTFASRAIVDLVIMAALFQAVGIWQRNRTQNTLYDSGQLDVFDPFQENDFFRKGMKRQNKKWVPTLRFEHKVEDHVSFRSQLGLPLVPYNERRLSELLNDPQTTLEVKAGADWMRRAYDVLVGTPAQKLGLLSDSWKTKQARSDLTSQNETAAPDEWRRQQKPRLEMVVSELLGEDRETKPKFLTDEDVLNLMRLLKRCGDWSEFHYARTEIVQLLKQASSHSPHAFGALIAQTCPTDSRYETWHAALTSMFGDAVLTTVRDQNKYSGPCFGREQDRKLCYEAMEELVKSYGDTPQHSMLEQVERYLSERVADEAITHARPAAISAYDYIAKLRRQPPIG